MGRPRKDDYVEEPVFQRPPATTPQARENQLIVLATDLVEKQLIDGTVSSQVLTHYLKLATAKENLERKKLIAENALLEARVKSIAAEGDIKVLLENALDAFRGYQGTQTEDELL